MKVTAKKMGQLHAAQVRKIERLLRSALPKDILTPGQIEDVKRTWGGLSQRLSHPSDCPLATFISERCYAIPGAFVKFSLFFESFKVWLEENDIFERVKWKQKHRVIKSLPRRFPYGIRSCNQRYIGNLSFTADVPPGAIITIRDGRLKTR